MRISDWSSDVCSSDLGLVAAGPRSLGKTAALEQLSTDEQAVAFEPSPLSQPLQSLCPEAPASDAIAIWTPISPASMADRLMPRARKTPRRSAKRSEEHTSELQSLMRSSYAVFCLKKKTHNTRQNQ